MLYDEYAEHVAKYKALYGDRVLVVFEVGSFYEWYNCDKNAGSDVQGVCELLNIVRTRKDKKIRQISHKNPEFGGVPSYAFAKYIPVLLENDYTIVLVTQHQSNGSIIRRVTNVISRGTNVDITGDAVRCYDGGRGNFVACIFLDSHTHTEIMTRFRSRVLHCGCALADLTTGVTFAYEINSRSDDLHFALDELHRIVREYSPTEVVIYGKKECLEYEKRREYSSTSFAPSSNNTVIEEGYDSRFSSFLRKIGLDGRGVYDRLDSLDTSRISSIRFQENVLKRVFPDTGFLSAVEALDLESRPHACAAFSGLMQFVFEHNEHVLQNITRPTVVNVCDGEDTYAIENSCDVTENTTSISPSNRRLMLNYNAAEQLDILCSDGSAITLCKLLNTCATNMGKRYFRHQMLHPLIDHECIEARLDEVTLFKDDPERLKRVRTALKRVGDLERVFRKIALCCMSPSEFSFLDSRLEALASLDAKSSITAKICGELSGKLRETYIGYIDISSSSSSCSPSEEAAVEENAADSSSPIIKRDVFDPCDSIFCKGVYPDVDELSAGLSSAKNVLEKIVDALNSAQGGKPFFKIDCFANNNSSSPVSPGNTASSKNYFIVGTHIRCEALKKQHQGRQTSIPPQQAKAFEHCTKETSYEKFDLSVIDVKHANSTTSYLSHPLLDRLNKDIKITECKIREIVDERYANFLKTLWFEHSHAMQVLARHACHLDYLAACAWNATNYKYTRPKILKDNDNGESSSFVCAKQLRHPVLEIIHDRVQHVPNDITVGSDGSTGVLVYGMNAAGKSCLMKAVALTVVMAQAGMFVPCDSAEIFPFAKIFTRIQSRDDISRGQSTFMVEVAELRNILKRCDARSLVIGDEICSGTESISALAIVGTSIRQLLDRHVPFLFATHLHELPRALDMSYEMMMPNRTRTRKRMSDLRICHLRVTYDGSSGKLTYDRRLCDGQGPTVYGLEVCKALDMDPAFIETAHAIRKSILDRKVILGGEKTSRYNAKVVVDRCGLCKSEKAVEVHHIRHQSEADEEGFVENGKIHKNVTFNLVPLCNACHSRVHHGEIEINGFVQTSGGIELSSVARSAKEASIAE
jgi:DNA mismatch repair protein MutS